jgi:hypothetical protein
MNPKPPMTAAQQTCPSSRFVLRELWRLFYIEILMEPSVCSFLVHVHLLRPYGDRYRVARSCYVALSEMSFLAVYGRDGVCFASIPLRKRPRSHLRVYRFTSIPPLLQFPPKPGKKPGPTMTEIMARRRKEYRCGALPTSSHHVGELLED